MIETGPNKFPAIAGLHMTDPKAIAVIDAHDWDGIWPEVEADGRYTSGVLDSDADIILVDWSDAGLTNRDTHASEAAIQRINAPESLIAEIDALSE